MLGTYEPYAGHSEALCWRDMKRAEKLCWEHMSRMLAIVKLYAYEIRKVRIIYAGKIGALSCP